MLKLWKPSQQPVSHEDVFAARYDQLLRWALRLTNNDRHEAEDLLHDAFIDFSLGQANLSAIENIDGYLRTVLRNIHLSAVRKASRHPTQPLSLVDYDSLAIGLRATEPHLRLQLQDELRAICLYACLRKETSKAGSALILRFFLDYYPSEVARVMRTTSRAVSEWLRIARAEARTYLEDPSRLNFLSKHATLFLPLEIDFGRAADNLSLEFRRALFGLAHVDACLDNEQLTHLFRSESEATIDSPILSQIVTCRRCLDDVNRLQGLPLLADRYSEEKPKVRPPSDSTGGGSEGGGPSPISFSAAGERDHMEESYRRVKEVFEHRPEELYISANGLFLVSQKISAGRAEQTLSVNIDEEIGFIEVLSEQSLRLLLLNIEPPPSGDGEQAKSVALSDGRELTATLRFSGPQPTLQVVYDDPGYRASASLDTKGVDAIADTSGALASRDVGSSVVSRIQNWISEILFNPHFWLRPSGVTAVLALMVAAALLFMKQPATPLTADELLQRSANAEAVLFAKGDQVVHRTLNLEIAEIADQSSGRKVTDHQRIEIWQSGEEKVTARRLYDERGELVAGVWTRPDGVRTLYQHGTRPQLQPSTQQNALANLTNNAPWLISPSASDFLATITGSNSSSLEERSDVYVVSYERPDLGNAGGLLRANLTLRKGDLHPTEMTMLVLADLATKPNTSRGQETRQSSGARSQKLIEYHFVETGFERHPANTISPIVFEPEPGLLSAITSETRNSKADLTTSTSAVPSVAPVTASAELEVELLRLLDQAGAFQGEQLSVTRTPANGLTVQAILDSAQRKAEILSALRPMLNNPAVHVQVETVTEASERLARARPPNAKSLDSTISIETVEVEKTALPVDAELRSYFLNRGIPNGRLDEEIRRYATRVIDRSLQALLHARALKQLAGQFSGETLRSLDAEARANWRAMLVEHARAFERETSGLRRELEPVFFPNAGGSDGNIDLEVGKDSDLIRAATRLFEEASAHERAISRAFSNSASSGPAKSAIMNHQFRRSLHNAELLANRIVHRR